MPHEKHDEIIAGLSEVRTTVSYIKENQDNLNIKIDGHFDKLNGRIRILEKNKNWLWGAWAGFTVAVAAVWQGIKHGL